ncbi:MAG: DJ-1/PfpI family protein, partial [Polyangiales bacterium]
MARVIIIGFDGVVALDMVGPSDVFASVVDSPYTVVFASSGGGQRRCASGLCVATQDLMRLRPHSTDTVIVAGGEEDALRAAVADTQLLRWITRAAKVVQRVASVCSGAFVLASA